MVKIKPKIRESVCYLYKKGNPDILIGKIDNELTLDDIRIQIAEEKSYNYFIEWKDQIIRIDKCGNLDKWPVGFFDTRNKKLDKLIDIHIERTNDAKTKKD